jgi:phosphomannomutase
VSIYKPCGICGDAETELSASLYETWGRTLGRAVPPNAKFLVAGDHRESTPAFLAALCEGLCQSGVDVVDLGRLPSPMVLYAKGRLNAAGCAIVTAPHASSIVNGLRWIIGAREPTPDDVAALERATAEDRTGQGRAGQGARTRTAPRSLDVSFDYVATLQETFVDFTSAQQRVVVDTMSGSWTGKARRYLQAIFPQCIFSTIHDADSPSENAPLRPAFADLCDAVYCERAHLGLGFDGDGLVLVDDEGVVLRPEEAAWAMLQCLGDELRGGRFVYDHKFSNRIPEAAKKLGAEPLVERSNCIAIGNRMREIGAAFGADVAGRYFFKAWGDGDDSLYAACRVIAHLARSGRKLSSLRRDCPPVFVTPELCVPAATPDEIVARLRAAWSEFPQQTLDGLRIETPGGWALVQNGDQDDSLAFRFEGIDWHALDDLVERFCDLAPECSDELWGRYRAAVGS